MKLIKPYQIKAAIGAAGLTQTALADELECSASAISAVINGRSRSARIEARLIALIGSPLFGPQKSRAAKATKAAGKEAA